MRDGNHNLKVSVETLSGFVYKHEKQTNGSQLVVKDEDGKILHQGEFKSFTANFMRLLFGNMIDGTPTAKAKSLDDSDVTITDIPVCKMNFKGGSGVQKFGVCVGNGLGAVANSDYALGFVSGLTYGATVVGTPSVVGSTIKLDITREISNTSGGAITLQESGLVCGVKPEDNDNNVLVARDLVVVSLANNKKSTWTYSIVVSFDGTAGGFVKNFLDSFIIDWTTVLANGHSQWSKRQYHQCLVFADKMWIIGGYAYSNDVLSSSDGITWTTVLADGHSQWSQRHAHQCIVFADKMWIIGGNDGSNLNDVWSWGKQLSSNALITDDTLGIVVGASDTAFTSTDTALATKIEHGTGATQVEYGVFPDTSVTAEPAISGSKTTMKLARRFENNSGASITIKEVGIMSENGLLCRVLIPSPFIVVANGASEVISFVFETEV